MDRIWCLYEIWHTFLIGVERLKVISSNADAAKLKKVFMECDVAKSEATVLADKERILEEIQRRCHFKK